MNQPSSDIISGAPLRPKLPGAITLLQQAGQTFRIHFGTFLGIILIPFVLYVAGLSWFVPRAGAMNNFTSTNIVMLVIAPLALGVIALWTGNAMFQFLLIDQQTKNVIQIYRATFKRLGAVLTTNLLLTFGILISFFVITFTDYLITQVGVIDGTSSNGLDWVSIVVPCIFFFTLVVTIWLLIKFIFTQTVVMKEGKANFAAIRRSSALMKGLWWPIFWRFFIFGLAYATYYILMNFIIGSVLQASTSDTSTTSFISNIFVTVVGEVTFGSIGYILIGRLYTILAGSTS